MEKKRSVGVTVLGVAILFYSLLGLIYGTYFLFHIFSYKSPYKSNTFHPLFLLYHSRTLVLLLYFIAGIGILRIKSWGRRFAFYCSILLLIYKARDFLVNIIPVIKNPKWASEVFSWVGLAFGGIRLIFPIGILLLFIFYLTRPKVREQFK